MPLTGARVGHYVIGGCLGVGEVYQARDTTLDRDIAINTLPYAMNAVAPAKRNTCRYGVACGNARPAI